MVPTLSKLVLVIVPKGTVLHWNGIPVEAIDTLHVLAAKANLRLIEAEHGTMIEYAENTTGEEM